MLRKLFMGAVMVAGVLAMALPASADAPARTAKFAKSHGAAGIVKMENVGGKWNGVGEFTGLSEGDYALFVAQKVKGGSAEGTLCSFHVKANQVSPATCHGTSNSNLMGDAWLKGSNNVAELDLLTNNTGVPVFRHDAVFRK